MASVNTVIDLDSGLGNIFAAFYEVRYVNFSPALVKLKFRLVVTLNVEFCTQHPL